MNKQFAATILVLLVFQIAENSYSIRKSKVAFTRTVADEEPDIFISYGDGSNVRQLTIHPSTDMNPTWSPDGKRIAFESIRGGTSQIWLIDTDRRNRTKLTDEISADSPAWSPDGNRIAYHSKHKESVNVKSEIQRFQICVIDINGNNRQSLTGAGNMQPCWSPGGSKIAFVSGRTNTDQIFIMDSNGQNPKQLTFDSGYKRSPTWSPDGEKIAYVSTARIWMINIESGNQRKLTGIKPRDHLSDIDGHPTWSPDSDKVLFHSTRDDLQLRTYMVDITSGITKPFLQLHEDSSYQPEWYQPMPRSVNSVDRLITTWGRLKVGVKQ